jgi:hypothetical protein
MVTSIPNQATEGLSRSEPRKKAFTLAFGSSVSSLELKPEIEAVERYFGGNSYSADSRTRDKIHDTILKACQIVSPLISFTIKSIQSANEDGSINLSDGHTLPLPDYASNPSASFLAAAIGTLGKELETECRLLAAQHHIYQSTLLDAVGTSMIDAMDIKIRCMIDDECRILGLSSGVRFAPGLNGYPLDHQQTLFQLADGSSVDVRLNDAFLMEPVKSISFFSLLGCEKVENRQSEKCLGCQLPRCQFRKGLLPAPDTGFGEDMAT